MDLDGGDTCASGSTACFVYNALGQRVEKQTGSSYVEYAYDAFGNMAATHNRTTITQRIYYLGGRPFAKHANGQTYFMHPNHLGSTTFVTDHAGATIQKTMYHPFGQVWQSGGTAQDSRFASMDPRDAETGNNPTLFRMQNPRLFRWLSPDPLAGDILDPQSLNRYAYVMNNPTNLIDPLGLDPEDVDWAARGQEHIDAISERIGRMEAQVALSFAFNVGIHLGGVGFNNLGPGIGFGGLAGGGGVVGWNPAGPVIPVNAPPPTLGGLLGMPASVQNCGFVACSDPAPNAFTAAALTLPALGGAAIGGAITTAVVFGTTFVAALVITDAIIHYSKGKEEVGHDYVRDLARRIPGDYCSNLKQIVDNARRAGNSKLFNDAKATWKQDCRGK